MSAIIQYLKFKPGGAEPGQDPKRKKFETMTPVSLLFDIQFAKMQMSKCVGSLTKGNLL